METDDILFSLLLDLNANALYSLDCTRGNVSCLIVTRTGYVLYLRRRFQSQERGLNLR